MSKLAEAREDFVEHWGSMGTNWGINRTVAKIHALLMTAPDPLSTDEVMDDLGISRGNANTSLRELIGWGLIRSISKRGERKEFFEAEKDVWKIACRIAKERKRREIDPAIAVMRECKTQVSGSKEKGAKEFGDQMDSLLEFVEFGSSVMEKVTASEEGAVMKMAAKFFR